MESRRQLTSVGHLLNGVASQRIGEEERAVEQAEQQRRLLHNLLHRAIDGRGVAVGQGVHGDDGDTM